MPPEPFVVTVPFPPAEVRPNGRAHWSVVARAKRMLRLAAFIDAMSKRAARDDIRWNGFAFEGKPSVSYVVYYPPRSRKWDDDNVIGSLKSALDGLQDAHVFKNDSGVKMRSPVHVTNQRKNPRVEILVWEE